MCIVYKYRTTLTDYDDIHGVGHIVTVTTPRSSYTPTVEPVPATRVTLSNRLIIYNGIPAVLERCYDLIHRKKSQNTRWRQSRGIRRKDQSFKVGLALDKQMQTS